MTSTTLNRFSILFYVLKFQGDISVERDTEQVFQDLLCNYPLRNLCNLKMILFLKKRKQEFSCVQSECTVCK